MKCHSNKINKSLKFTHVTTVYYDLLSKNLFKCLLLVLFLSSQRAYSIGTNNSTLSNDFVERCRRDCVIKRDVVVCGKYRVVRWLHEAREKDFTYGPLKVITIPVVRSDVILPELSRSRNFKFGIGESLKFLRDVAEDFVKRKALVYTYEPSLGAARAFGNGPIILDEDELVQMQRGVADNWRLFKKKKSIIFPIIILVELLKLKLIMIPIFLGVHLIKKLIIIGGLFVPGILSKLKICKVPQPHHVWATGGDGPVDYPTGYGHEDPGWAHRNDLYQGHVGAYHGYHSPFSQYYRQR